jgi:hypothetical protein
MHRESTNAHPPKDSDKPAPLHWRQRKKLVARRRQLEEESAARKPAMIAAYVEALGGNVTEIQKADIERAVDLTLIAAEMRTAVRLGTAKVSQLTTLEGHADRARRRLNLPGDDPGSAAPVMDLHDHAARRALERGERAFGGARQPATAGGE